MCKLLSKISFKSSIYIVVAYALPNMLLIMIIMQNFQFRTELYCNCDRIEYENFFHYKQQSTYRVVIIGDGLYFGYILDKGAKIATKLAIRRFIWEMDTGNAAPYMDPIMASPWHLHGIIIINHYHN